MISIKNADKKIKNKEVLKSINVTFQDGDFVLLKGHNGCGKTMLLRLIAGLITADSGSVSTDQAYRYGVIIENPSFLLGETALYNLKYLASITGRINTEQILEYMKEFNLYDVRNKKVRTFSLGMKQRLALVQAMMENPDVLLLDEPFNAIDDDNLEMVYKKLDACHSEGKIIIVASHGDYTEKCEFNRVITMNNGKIKSDQDIGF